MQFKPYYPTSNNSAGIEDQQAHAYCSLLTQLSKTIASLQTQVVTSPNLGGDIEFTAVECWGYLLNDLATVLLPELYVVFHDSTTMNIQRRRLYDMTQAIYFTMEHYAKTGFLFKISGITESESSSLNPMQYDLYTIGQGSNAEVAFKLSKLASASKIDTFDYLDVFEPYYQLLISEKELCEFLTSVEPQRLKHKLSEFQKRRLLAFSIPTVVNLTLINELPELKNIKHGLAVWLLQHHIAQDLESLDKKQSLNTAVTHQTQASTDAKPHPKLIDNPKAFSLGLILLGFGLYGVFTFSPTYLVLYLFLIWPVLYLIVSSLNISENYEGYKIASNIGLWVSLPIMFFGVPFFVISVHLFLISLWVRIRCAGLNIKAPSFLQEDKEQNQLIINSNHRGDYKQLTQKFDAIRDFNTTVSAQSTKYHFPLTIESVGSHLAKLLSEAPTLHLRQLIKSTNTLYESLEYLQETHPYLASRVDELIKDLIQNTIVRLDELASHFVKEGQVDASAQALFLEQHEERIADLISLNLSQVDNLNATILEKKMSGFAQVGSADERKFRDAVMELKILIRWLITQQPDEVRATSHQVILDSLETTTLVKMQEIFFDSHTTSEQRQQLQHQVEQLLEHFKQQTVYDMKLLSVAEDTTGIHDLLQLSQSNADGIQSLADMDAVNKQTKAQEFIDVNQFYVKQLMTHWK